MDTWQDHDAGLQEVSEYMIRPLWKLWTTELQVLLRPSSSPIHKNMKELDMHSCKHGFHAPNSDMLQLEPAQWVIIRIMHMGIGEVVCPWLPRLLACGAVIMKLCWAMIPPTLGIQTLLLCLSLDRPWSQPFRPLLPDFRPTQVSLHYHHLLREMRTRGIYLSHEYP